MGNTPSSANKSAEIEFEDFYQIIDYVATYYILTMDFKSLSKLSEKEYCDKLIILTSDIIEKYLTAHEITYLEQRVKEGVEVNTLNNEKFVFIDKDKLDSLDISHHTKQSIKENVKKGRVCKGIAKFYIKIAHIFAAIVMTINPSFTYKDPATGLTMKASMMEKDKIPKKADKKVLRSNICDNRIHALKRNESINEDTNEVTLEPDICEINASASGMTKTLEEEPGIPELMQLYYDQYDSKTGTFTGMTPETKALFDSDLKAFYTAFTGEETMPPEVVRFSDIKLKDYAKTPNCEGPEAKFRAGVKIPTQDDLFKAYAENLQTMIQTAADNQVKLLEVINELFAYSKDPNDDKKILIRVNPALTEKTLQDAVLKTRRYISDLYIKCAQDYERGVQLYAAIVESKNAVIVPRQIQSVTEESERMIESARIPPVVEGDESVIELGEKQIKAPELEISEELKKEVHPESETISESTFSEVSSLPSLEPDNKDISMTGKPEESSVAYGQAPPLAPVAGEPVADKPLAPPLDPLAGQPFADKPFPSVADKPLAPPLDPLAGQPFADPLAGPPALPPVLAPIPTLDQGQQKATPLGGKLSKKNKKNTTKRRKR